MIITMCLHRNQIVDLLDTLLAKFCSLARSDGPRHALYTGVLWARMTGGGFAGWIRAHGGPNELEDAGHTDWLVHASFCQFRILRDEPTQSLMRGLRSSLDRRVSAAC
jgi:hypothetical protein